MTSTAMPRAAGRAARSLNISSHRPHPGREYTENRMGWGLLRQAPLVAGWLAAAIDFYRVRNELHRLRGNLAHRGYLVALHDGGERIPRADAGQSLHGSLRWGVGGNGRTGCSRRLLFDEYGHGRQSIGINQMTRRHRGASQGLRTLYRQTKSRGQLAGAVGTERRGCAVGRRPLAHPAHSLGTHGGRQVAIRNVFRHIQARKEYLLDDLTA